MKQHNPVIFNPYDLTVKSYATVLQMRKMLKGSEMVTLAPVFVKAEYKYGAKLPHKARGIDVSIEPKMFCESAAIKTEDYMIEEKYTATRHEGYYSDSYSGRETLTFPNCTDGFVIYTQKLKDGGNKDNRNVVPSKS